MDEELLRQLLAEQDGIEFSPTPEMMMMNSAAVNDNDTLDIEISEMIQQQQQQEHIVRANPPAVTSTRTDPDDDDLLLEDETILERIIALKEMFPESVQNAVGTLNHTVINATKTAYSKGRTATWWITSTMCVLVFPILIQKELLQVAEQISREQRSILLGPQAATSAISGGAF
ncbi:unnamed protein product [Rotaria sp. Silwood2]|nr:unnamed protein product [Rotaria sp. Silwood2]CAF2523319.1 unnamed protein product [Rotaria sp. Silwood2]CAF2768749.1 unnamed protein product [Rotaria sp. Silwood2]CAF2944765.1 unnamed protein product [Rotaria sp. Silwood2]CAF3886901.1 unnamed protein product [Rotaria sp. Silwood2]